MWSFSGNFKTPTSQEINVLRAIFSILVVFVFCLGIYLLYLSFGQPVEKSRLALRSRWIGLAFAFGSVAVKYRWVLRAITWLDWARKRCF